MFYVGKFICGWILIGHILSMRETCATSFPSDSFASHLLTSSANHLYTKDYSGNIEYNYPDNQEAALKQELYRQEPISNNVIGGHYDTETLQNEATNALLASAQGATQSVNPYYSALLMQAYMQGISPELVGDYENVQGLSESLSSPSGVMSDAARMLSHYPLYQQQQYHPMMAGYGYHDPYGFQMKKHMDGYHDDDDHYHDDDHDDHYKPKKKKKKKKKKKVIKKVVKKKVYVPIVIKKKKKKKRKTIAVYKGFYIPGGSQIFGKFKKMKDCKKACEITPTCFAADYNPWLKKCYIHTNLTACEEMRTHPKLIHFKKVPCDLLETPRGLITLGTKINGGLEQKGVKNLQQCIKKCATAGQGIAPTNSEEDLRRQICFGIDYDFSNHKCYFHTDETLCPEQPIIPTPASLVEMPSVINILLCPFTV